MAIVNQQNYHETKAFIESVPLFKTLTAAQKEALIGSFSIQTFRPNEPIVNEGDPGDLFYLITEGVVACSSGGTELPKMHAGHFFGEQTLFYTTTRTASVRSVGHVKCLAIDRETLRRVLGSRIQSIIHQNSIRIAFAKSQVFSVLTSEQVLHVCETAPRKEFQSGDVVIPAGTVKGRQL